MQRAGQTADLTHKGRKREGKKRKKEGTKGGREDAGGVSQRFIWVSPCKVSATT